jgi:hypothetical protein
MDGRDILSEVVGPGYHETTLQLFNLLFMFALLHGLLLLCLIKQNQQDSSWPIVVATLNLRFADQVPLSIHNRSPCNLSNFLDH